MSAETRSVSAVRATDHARTRFRDRSSHPSDSVLAAWRDGRQIRIPDEAPVPSADEYRYDSASDTVVCRIGPRLTTAYGLLPAHLTNIYGVAVAAAVDEQFGTEYCAEIDPRNLEEAR